MSKAATLLLALSAVFLFSIANYNMGRNLTTATENAVLQYEQTMARGLANSVADMLLAKVSDSASWRAESPQQVDFFDGSAEYTVRDTTVSGDPMIHVVAEGSYGGEIDTVIVFARLPDAVPPFLKYGVLSHDDLNVNGLNNLFRDAFNTQWNANMHTNARLILNVTNYQQRGFATYSNSITANFGEVTITPNQNPDGLPVHYLAPVVPIPVFNPDAYVSKATTIHAGDATYSGSITLGTKVNPAIVYVGGKLLISGTVSGYGVFVVKDDIEVTGSVQLSSIDSRNSKLALYTGGKIIINNENTTLHAQMLANNEVVVNAKNARLYGSITTRSKATFNAEGIHLYYKPALDALTIPFWEVPVRRLVALHRYE